MPDLEAGVDRGKKIAPVFTLGELRRRGHVVLVDTQHGFFRRPASDGSIERGAEGVEVGPGPLQAPIRGVLLVRAVAGFHDARERAAHLGHRATCGAKVEQHGRAVAAHDDVVGGDVAVQEVGRVHHFQRVEQRRDEAIELLLFGQSVETAKPVLEAHALLEAHHHVRGGVGLENAADAHDAGVLEARQGARFLEEVDAPLLEGGLVALRFRPHAHGGVAVAEVDGVILLDRHHGAEVDILGLVGDAKPARADDAQDAVVVVQDRVDRQYQAAVQGAPHPTKLRGGSYQENCVLGK